MTVTDPDPAPHPWQQLHIDAQADQAEAMATALNEAGALSVTFMDSADNPVLEPDPGATPLWAQTTVVALFPDTAILDSIALTLQHTFGPQLTWRREVLADQDWERTCLRDFKPLKFGSQLWICPSWDSAPDPTAIVVKLDPGLAFGTGTHPTTALCLEWLANNPPEGQIVIDYGCGSGILAVAAARLGARRVYAIDHDPQALVATQENAYKNNVSTIIQPGGSTNLIREQGELIIANILLEPLIELVETFYRLLMPHSHLVVSGILRDQISTIVRNYAPWFKIQSEQTMENWALLDFTRMSDPRE